MTEDAELRGTTTLDGFRVLWVGIKREPTVFTVATLGAVLVALVWTVGAVFAVRRRFRWEPRR